MAINDEQIGSREYKLMLKSGLFRGDEPTVLDSASAFWSDFAKATEAIAETSGNLDTVDKRRLSRFYDTADFLLRRHSYVFRERVKSSGKREVTLKFRHPDRYFAQDRNMDAPEPDDSKDKKFEQDLKPPFQQLYSFSSKQKIGQGKILDKLKDPIGLYPDLANHLSNADPDAPIEIVGAFTAREVVITGGIIKLKQDETAALIIWYDEDGNAARPVAVEFSFKYKAADEEFDGVTAKRAFDVFGAVAKMKKWTDPISRTKTAYAYAQAGYP